MGKQTNQQRARDQHSVDTQVDSEKGRKLKEVRVRVSVDTINLFVVRCDRGVRGAHASFPHNTCF